MTATVLRTSKKGEEAHLGKTGWEAFRFGQPDFWTGYYREHAHRKPEDTIVATIGGAIAGHATALRFQMRLGGKDVPMRGIAAVAVVPEYRRRGVATRMMTGILEGMRDRGEALTLLYPYDAAFYNRLGYGLVEWTERALVPPRLLPDSPERLNVRRLDRKKDLADVRRVYELARAAETGPIARTPWWWETRVFGRIPDGVVHTGAGGKVDGYLLYELPETPKHPRQHCLIKELAATTPAAFRGLVAFVKGLGEQLERVELELPPGEAVTLLDGMPADPDALRVVPGAMARLVDLPAALALHPGLATAEGFGLDVRDPLLGDTSLDLGPRARRAKERLVLGIDRLSQIYFRGASAAALLRNGLIDGSPLAASRLDAACAIPPAHLRIPNHF